MRSLDRNGHLLVLSVCFSCTHSPALQLVSVGSIQSWLSRGPDKSSIPIQVTQVHPLARWPYRIAFLLC
jgi:hypothetical protein